MIVVSDASPIINLAVIDHLHLLQKLYDKVVIRKQSMTRLWLKAGQAGAADVAQVDWIEVQHIANRPLAISLAGDLDIGEAEAIVLKALFALAGEGLASWLGALIAAGGPALAAVRILTGFPIGADMVLQPIKAALQTSYWATLFNASDKTSKDLNSARQFFHSRKPESHC